MEYINLKNSEIVASRICMGGCPMGQYGWGTTAEDELVAAVHAALDGGINMFDTADTYGLGTSEQILGKALKSQRDKAIICTKFGVRIQNGKTFYDNTPQWIEESVVGSLRRLNTEYIDLYQIHYRDNTPIIRIIETLDKLREKGYVRAFGLSNLHEQDIKEIKDYSDSFFSSVQDEFSLACRKNEKDLINASEELHLTPMTWGSLGQGILTGKYDINSTFEQGDRRNREIYINFHGEKLKHNLRIVEAMRPIAEAHKVSIASVAIRFILDYLKDSIVLVGAKRPSQIMGNIEAVGWSLADEEKDLLNKLSLI